MRYLLLALAVLVSPAAWAKPNIVLVIADDMEAPFSRHMPTVINEIANQGLTFTKAYFNQPLCGPSRAAMLSAKYQQNTGVNTNQVYAPWLKAGGPLDDFPVWLQAAGYRTGLVGKYVNGYSKTVAPPATWGWSDWAASRSGVKYYSHYLNDNGVNRFYGTAPSDYSTDVYRGHALAFLDAALADGVPFFLQIGVVAPHSPSTPAPRHTATFPGLTVPLSPSINEADVGDKPAYIRNRGKVNLNQGVYRKRAQSLLAVDELLADIIGTLKAAGQLDNTYLVFTSDNGLLYGEHRLQGVKGLPYEEVIRMPLYIRGPGIPHGTDSRLAGNVDLGPTIAGWAGATVPTAKVDGRSLTAPGRQSYPLHHTCEGSCNLLSWRGVRTQRYTYVEYETGERELYDNPADPYQLQNLAATAAPSLLQRLAELTADLAACRGEQCRALENEPSP